MAESKTTTDHKEIQKWAEAREGKPSSVKSTGSANDAGLLRINFPGGKEDTLEDITWEDFFQKFDEQQLAFLYQEKTADGKISRFNKLISRETAENSKSKTKSTGKAGASKTAGSQRTSAAKGSGEAKKTEKSKSTKSSKSASGKAK